MSFFHDIPQFGVVIYVYSRPDFNFVVPYKMYFSAGGVFFLIFQSFRQRIGDDRVHSLARSGGHLPYADE